MKYDYIFAGCGLSTLIVLNEMFEADLLSKKNILIVEPNEIVLIEKTWCFWENKNESYWDEFVYKIWNKAFFLNNTNAIECLSDDFYYKMIFSNEFLPSLLEKINRSNNISIVKENYVSFVETDVDVVVKTNLNEYSSDYFLSSVLQNTNFKNTKKYPLLQQHFLGWFIKVEEPIIDDSKVTFMDFSVFQNENTRFMYVLPYSKYEALFEFTLFSRDVLNDNEYEEEIKEYLKCKNIENYSIIKKEKGNIPMTSYPFWKENTKRVLLIGTAGGWTKASTGYTFNKTCRKAKEVVKFLKSETIDFRTFHKWSKYDFYDSIFINVLFTNNELGNKIFASMFEKVNPTLILKFLDEDTSLFEDLQIIWSCPKIPFVKAFFRKFNM